MKFLSILRIFKGIDRVAKRFPFAVLVALAGTVVGISNIHLADSDNLLNILLTLILAAPLFVGTVLFSEARTLGVKHHWGLHALIVLFLVAYYLLLPERTVALDEFYVRHTMWTIGFILVITFIPFFFQQTDEAVQRFWQYNRGLVFALILTGFWGVALQIGLSIALASIGFLFDLNIRPEWFQDIWVVIVGLFSPFFFLYRLPVHPHNLKGDNAYPKEVRLFAQFVLVPMVTLYFLILYAYTIRVLVTFEWPAGQLAWMILGFSFLGVLTYLALFPLRQTERWVRIFGTGLFYVMIPQTGMLYWALSFRIRDYGLTENRYFILVFGIWLLGIALYYLVGRAKDIRLIPISLFFVSLVTSFGPWGAFGVAERSQIHRLETILERNGLLHDGLYVQSSTELSIEDEVQINEIIRYLNARHGFDGIESWFGGEDLDGRTLDRWETEERVITEKFGLTIRYPYETMEFYSGRRSFNLYTDSLDDTGILIEGYEYVVPLSYQELKTTFDVDDQTYSFLVQNDRQVAEFKKDDVIIATFDLSDLIERGRKGNGNGNGENLPRKEIILTTENENVRLMLSLQNFFGEFEGDDLTVYSLEGLLFLQFK